VGGCRNSSVWRRWQCLVELSALGGVGDGRVSDSKHEKGGEGGNFNGRDVKGGPGFSRQGPSR
jgi:hypothetical protein